MKKLKSILKRGCSILMASVVAAAGVTVMSGITSAASGETAADNNEISRKAAADSMVLLKNNESVLPLGSSDKVAVFGSAQVNTFMTVFGSGSTNGIGLGFIDTLSELKTRIKVDSTLEQLYRRFAQTNPPDMGQTYVDNEILSKCYIPEMTLSDDTVSAAAGRCGKAVIFIGRTNGEGYDWKIKDEYSLRTEEKQMIDLVTKYFDKVIVVLNTASAIDMTWDSEKIDGIVWMGICGDKGAAALTDVLTGEVNPSGKLTQTWAEKYSDTPTHMNYEMTNTPAGLHGPEIKYEEDIYAGYRYYDTFGVTPKFPFGFGLSYTKFTITTVGTSVKDETVTVTARVRNTGYVAGKEVVQLYYSAPDGKLDKAYQELAAFAKTGLLEPGETETLTLSYSLRDMASYDESQAAYILEAGEYILRLGNSSRSTSVAGVISLDKTAVTEQLSNLMNEAVPIDRFDKAGAVSYTYDGEAAEVSAAKRINVKASDIKAVSNANTISDDPALLEGSVGVQAASAVSSQKTDEGYAVAAADTQSKFTLPGVIHCADLGIGFAGFVVNDPSGDKDGYKSVTVQSAGTQMPFEVEPLYGGNYRLTLRYFVDTPSTVTLKDSRNNQLCTFNLSTTGQWAEAVAERVDLTGVTGLVIVTGNDNINLNSLSVQSLEYAGKVAATLGSGSYPSAVKVGLYNSDCPTAVIRYTTDGSRPTSSSPVYTAPFEISSGMTVKAAAFASGMKDSAVATYEYTIDSSITAAAVRPAASFIGRDGAGNQLVAFRAGEGMSVFYTLDGSVPDSGDNYYTEPVAVSKGVEVKAVAVGPGCKYSVVTSVKIAEIAAPESALESGGTYLTGKEMSLSAASGCDIYYTMTADGSIPADPTTASAKYTSAIKLNTNGTVRIKAVAVSAIGGMSEISEFVYRITDKVYTLEDVYYGDATVEQVVAQMNLTELCEVVANGARSSRFLCPSVSYTDGPLGVKQGNFTKWAAPSLLACSWDVDLMAEQGNAVGRELVENNIDFWLAPGVNLLRDPRSGRNAEYYAEDAVLSGILASAVINGVQSHGVGCVVKHFVGNDQETHRKQCADVVVSERALREIYLKSFEIVVKSSQPWGLMTTYCDVNRMATSTNFELCTAIPRGEWGFENLIMTDWSCYADNSMMMYAGNDLIMPSGSVDVIKNAVLDPSSVNTSDPNYTAPTTKAMLQRNVVNIFKTMLKTRAFAKSIGSHSISTVNNTELMAVDHFSTSSGIGSEGCSDPGVSQNPTYTDGGTWLEYRVTAEHDSWFKFTPRVSVNAAGAGFNLLVDGEKAASFLSLSSTGGWQNWTSLASQNIFLKAGRHTLRIEFAESGMNVSKFLFEPITGIASVTGPKNRIVAFGTQLSELGLPDSLPAGLSTGQPVQVSVVWNTAAYKPDVAGTYNIIGSLTLPDGVANFSGITAGFTVTVLDKATAASVTEMINRLPLPKNITEAERLAIESARVAYESLSSADKAKVKNLDKLEAAEHALDHPVPDFLPGDVDNNGTVNVSDMIALKNLIMSGKWSSEQLLRGDMNDDGNLTVSDMLAIKNIIMSQ